MTIWPPAPTDSPIDVPLPRKTLTGEVWSDFLIGFLMQGVLHFATARLLVTFLPPITGYSRYDIWGPASAKGAFLIYEGVGAAIFGAASYLGCRNYPAVVRGVTWGYWTLVVILLGAFMTCTPLKI